MGPNESKEPPIASSAIPPSPDPTAGRELFRTIFESNFTYVWNALRRLGVRPADREDLAHEVFVRVYRAVDTYDPSRPARPWLFAFAVRVASDYRNLARHREVPFDDEKDAPRGPTPDESVERAQRQALVQVGLEAVDFEKRAVVILHDLEEQPVPEIARVLSIPEGTAYSRLRAGREQFAAAVRREQLRVRNP